MKFILLFILCSCASANKTYMEKDLYPIILKIKKHAYTEKLKNSTISVKYKRNIGVQAYCMLDNNGNELIIDYKFKNKSLNYKEYKLDQWYTKCSKSEYSYGHKVDIYY